MRPRVVLWPVLSSIVGVALIYALRLFLGTWPHITVALGVLLTTFGVGLIASRFSRLGPFEGELGAPWFENDLHETLLWEYDRAARYGRVVTVIVMRQRSGTTDWRFGIRGVDRVIPCRDDWLIAILPETTRDGAMTMLRRLSDLGQFDRAVVLQLPQDVDHRNRLRQAIRTGLHAETRPGAVLLLREGAAESLPLLA